VERVAENKINALLPEYVGPADRYASRVRGSPGAIARGRMKSVHVDGVNVRLSEELTADHLALDLVEVDVDTRSRRLSRIGSVAFAAALGEENLNRYVRARRPDIAGLRVTLPPAAAGGSSVAQATVYARPEIFGVAAAPIAVDGRITPRPGGDQLDFVPGSARVSVVPVPAPALRFLAERLNPVVDLTTLRIPVRVERTELRDGKLVLTGRVDPEDLLRLGGAESPPVGDPPR
jgi:hypothetical protein